MPDLVPGKPLSAFRQPHHDIGVSFLAVIHIFRACWRLYQTDRILWWYVYYQIWPNEKLTIYGPPFTMLLLVSSCELIVLAAGAGMLFSARWGWWLAGFVYSYVIVRAIYMITVTFIRQDELQQAGQSIDYAGYVYQIFLFAALLMYLYSGRALRHFNLQDVRKRKSAAIQFAVAISVLVLTTVISAMILLTQGTSVPWTE